MVDFSLVDLQHALLSAQSAYDRGWTTNQTENPNVLAPVVQTLDSAIYRINHYPMDKY